MNKKILITGASGFIGKNLIEMLADRYTILAPRSAELDLLDQESVESYLKKHQFDQVIHAAVYHVTRNSGKDPLIGLSNNLRMFFNLARCNSSYQRMIYFGSGAEFGKQRSIVSVSEEDFGRVVPADEYGLYKYALTNMLSSYRNIYNLRLFGIFGKYEDWQIRFISNAICKALFDMDITIKKNVYFDYMYIDDLIPILTYCMEAENVPYQVMNVCSGKKNDLYTIAHIVRNISGKNLKIKVLSDGYANEYTAENGRLREVIPDVHFTPIENAIEKLYAWYTKNRQMLDPEKLKIDP